MPPYDIEPDPFPHTPVRWDNWQNPYMGFGTTRDKLTHGFHTWSPRLDDVELSTLYYSDDVAAKLVEKRPEEAFRRGYRLCNKANQQAAEDLVKLGKSLGVDAKVQEGLTWGRLFGGAILVIGAEAGNPIAPLDEFKVREVRFLNVVDRRYVTPKEYYLDPLKANYGQPKIYTVAGSVGLSTDIHESRVIRFDGTPVDAQKRLELGGWTYSVLQRPYDVMRAFATSFQAAGVLTADASQAVFKMKGLFDMIASGNKERLQTRMQLVDMSRSAVRAILLDSDGEEFERVKTEFTGLPEMLDRMMMRLASSVDMPVTILMGRSPAGQNATGDSDFQHWYDSIASQQGKEIAPKLLKLYRILSKGTLPDLEIEWNPLAELTEEQKVNIAKVKADTYKTYVDMGALFGEEVALAEFGKEGNGKIEIDEAARKSSLEMEKEVASQEPDLNAPPPVSPSQA